MLSAVAVWLFQPCMKAISKHTGTNARSGRRLRAAAQPPLWAQALAAEQIES